MGKKSLATELNRTCSLACLTQTELINRFKSPFELEIINLTSIMNKT